MLLDRYDTSKDGLWCFTEFSQLFLPWTSNYRSTMVGRSRTEVSSFHAYTVQTRKLLKDLLYSLLQVQENFEANRFKVTAGHYASSNQLFDWIDTTKD